MRYTVAAYLRDIPDTAADIMTPQGVLRLSARAGQEILTSKEGRQKLKINNFGAEVNAGELLEYVITKIVPYKNCRNQVFLLTNPQETMKASCYRPDLRFEQLAFDLSDLPPQWLE